jgi:hypothetical protein
MIPIARTYTFSSREPSVLTEIYLPKKASYQATLYDTLTKGFNLNYREHFKGDSEKKIKDFISQFRAYEDYDKLASREKSIFFGYSIYEVDGVFHNGEGATFEERTQVVRIIFKPDYDTIIKILDCEGVKNPENPENMRTLKAIARESLGLSRTQRIEVRDSQYPEKQSWRRKAFDMICEWADDVGFFLIGYIVYELSVGESNVEEEIWVSSIWTFDVNVIRKNNQ